MSTYKLFFNGEHVNTVIAETDFIESNYPDHTYVEVPPSQEKSHLEEFSPKELYDSFTTDEALLALMSSNPAVVAQAQLLTVNRGVTVSFNDAGYQ